MGQKIIGFAAILLMVGIFSFGFYANFYDRFNEYILLKNSGKESVATVTDRFTRNYHTASGRIKKNTFTTIIYDGYKKNVERDIDNDIINIIYLPKQPDKVIEGYKSDNLFILYGRNSSISGLLIFSIFLLFLYIVLFYAIYINISSFIKLVFHKIKTPSKNLKEANPILITNANNNSSKQIQNEKINEISTEIKDTIDMKKKIYIVISALLISLSILFVGYLFALNNRYEVIDDYYVLDKWSKNIYTYEGEFVKKMGN